MDLSSLLQLLWVAGIVCQAALGIVLLVKKAWRYFPFFSAYIGAGLAGSTFIYAFQHHKAIYFYSYWLMESIGIVLGFAVVYEVFRILFAAHPGLRRLARVTFTCVLTLLLLVGVVVMAKHSPVGFSSITSAVLVVEQAARIIEVGLLMCLFLLSTAFGMHWRQQVFGVALGLGVFVAVELITITVRGQAGRAAYHLLSLVRVAGFNISLLIWIGYLLAPERSTKSTVELPERSQLEQWNQAVMELIRQ